MARNTEFEAPPDYAPTSPAQLLSVDQSSLANPLSKQKISISDSIVHLKLIHAFHQLHTSVSNSDGLFGIKNSFARAKSGLTLDEELDLIGEKRWAIYVARAVDRFEAWWKTCIPTSVGGRPVTRLKLRGMVKKDDFENWLDEARKLKFGTALMPPLGASSLSFRTLRW